MSKLLLLSLLAGCASASSGLDRFVKNTEKSGATVAVLVVDGDSGSVYFAHRPGARALPASAQKLATTLFALETLGADYRYTTRIFSGPDQTLCIEASGDPSFGSKRFEETARLVDDLAERIALLGVRRWQGSLARCRADDAPLLGPGWAWDDAGAWFSARPTRLVVFENVVRWRLVRDGDTVRASDDALVRAGLTLRARVDPTVTELTCTRAPGASLLECVAPLNERAWNEETAVDDPLRMLAARLQDALRSRGIEWSGTLAEPPPSLDAFAVLHEVQSPPLHELVRVTNQASLNLYAERLALTATERLTGRGTYDDLGRALGEWLASLGIPTSDATLVDGSGLSRLNALTPRSLVALLVQATARPSGPKWLTSFAIAGKNGTLKRRGKTSNADGYVFAKTGSLSHQRALAGVAYRPDRTPHVLLFAALIANHPGDLAQTNRVLDDLLLALTSPLDRQAVSPRGRADPSSNTR